MANDPTKLSGYDPTIGNFVKELSAMKGPPLYRLTPTEARQVLLDVQKAPVQLPDVSSEDRTIPVGPTGKTNIRIYRPKGVSGDLPVIIYMHGGGWILGDKTTHDRFVRELTEGTRAAVFFVDYERSPEARYPVAIEQGYAVMQWVVANGPSLHVDPSRLIVAGESVGGNMSAALALMAKERKGPHIDFQALLYPVTDCDFTTPSYEAFADGPWLTREAMRWFWDAYLSDAKARLQPTASPLRASVDQLRGLPPALILTNEYDVLRDEAEAYAHKLAEAGVPVTATRHLGAIHDLVLINPITESPIVRGAVRQIIAIISDALAATEEKPREYRAGAEAPAPRH